MKERGKIILEYFNIQEEEITKHGDGNNTLIHSNNYKHVLHVDKD